VFVPTSGSFENKQHKKTIQQNKKRFERATTVYRETFSDSCKHVIRKYACLNAVAGDLQHG
jgi:hypothetical protein